MPRHHNPIEHAISGKATCCPKRLLLRVRQPEEANDHDFRLTWISAELLGRIHQQTIDLANGTRSLKFYGAALCLEVCARAFLAGIEKRSRHAGLHCNPQLLAIRSAPLHVPWLLAKRSPSEVNAVDVAETVEKPVGRWRRTKGPSHLSWTFSEHLQSRVKTITLF